MMAGRIEGFGVSKREGFMSASDQQPLGRNVVTVRIRDPGGASTRANSGSLEAIHPASNE